MTDDSGRGKLEFEGIWLSKGGEILGVQGSQLGEEIEEGDELEAKVGNAGKSDYPSSSNMDIDGYEEVNKSEGEEERQMASRRKKLLEIVTDSPGSLGHASSVARTGGGSGLLGGVMGWDYLLGEMFGADHVGIGVDGMCLVQDCIGGTGQPAGIGDVFFRRCGSLHGSEAKEREERESNPHVRISGPEGSDYFSHPWMFQAYVPDVIVSTANSRTSA
jgi:hypothetical protein